MPNLLRRALVAQAPANALTNPYTRSAALSRTAPPSELACSWLNLANSGLSNRSGNRTVCGTVSVEFAQREDVLGGVMADEARGSQSDTQGGVFFRRAEENRDKIVEGFSALTEQDDPTHSAIAGYMSRIIDPSHH